MLSVFSVPFHFLFISVISKRTPQWLLNYTSLLRSHPSPRIRKHYSPTTTFQQLRGKPILSCFLEKMWKPPYPKLTRFGPNWLSG